MMKKPDGESPCPVRFETNVATFVATFCLCNTLEEKGKTLYPLRHKAFLVELLSRFELETSSLPTIFYV